MIKINFGKKSICLPSITYEWSTHAFCSRLGVKSKLHKFSSVIFYMNTIFFDDSPNNIYLPFCSKTAFANSTRRLAACKNSGVSVCV